MSQIQAERLQFQSTVKEALDRVEKLTEKLTATTLGPAGNLPEVPVSLTPPVTSTPVPPVSLPLPSVSVPTSTGFGRVES